MSSSAASEAFRDALHLDPDLREAHRGLAAALERNGDPVAAKPKCWRKAFPAGSLEISPYRGVGPPVRVLLLTSAMGGNIPIKHLLDDRVFEVATLIAESYPGATALPPHGVVLNAIGEADRSARALEIIEGALGRGEAAIVNHPAAVRATGRVDERAAPRGDPGRRDAAIVRVARKELIAADGAALLAALDFEWPVLLRSPGFHTGEHFTLVEHAARVQQVAESLPGPDLLAISYIDTRRDDGTWRKYRVMFVDGRPYPLHLAISTHWKVHYFSAAMADRADYREEERAFLEDMPGVLGTTAMDALHRIAAMLGLDYGGIDFALDPPGRVVVFEANATMVITRSTTTSAGPTGVPRSTASPTRFARCWSSASAEGSGRLPGYPSDGAVLARDQLLAARSGDGDVATLRRRRGARGLRPHRRARAGRRAVLFALGRLSARSRTSSRPRCSRGSRPSPISPPPPGCSTMPTLFCGHMSGVNWLPEWTLDADLRPAGSAPSPASANRVRDRQLLHRSRCSTRRLLFARPPANVCARIPPSRMGSRQRVQQPARAGQRGRCAPNWVAPADRGAAKRRRASRSTAGTHGEDLTRDRNMRLVVAVRAVRVRDDARLAGL